MHNGVKRNSGTVDGGSTFCTLLDATKAFDRVNYCKLFTKLMSRNIPPKYLCLLLNMYTSSVARVSCHACLASMAKCIVRFLNCSRFESQCSELIKHAGHLTKCVVCAFGQMLCISPIGHMCCAFCVKCALHYLIQQANTLKLRAQK